MPLQKHSGSHRETRSDTLNELAYLCVVPNPASLEFGQELCSGDAKGSGTRPKLVVAGGVAANSALRKGLTEAAEENGIDLYIPDPILCTDNGAMIGAAAYYKYRASGPDDLTLDAYADLEM